MQTEIIAKCEECVHPFGIDNPSPVFSWKVKMPGDLKYQSAVHISVSSGRQDLEMKKNLLWDETVITDQPFITYRGSPLQSETTYFWKLILICDENHMLESKVCTFTTGFLTKDCWKASWIILSEEPLRRDEPELDEAGDALPIPLDETLLGPVHQVRKEFQVRDAVKRASLYVTAHGVYLPILDGKQIGAQELAPGYSDYNNQLNYQVYEITEALTKGGHTIGAYVADGWYRGRIGFPGDNCQYGTELAILMQLEITYENGTTEHICSDDSFEVTEGAYIYSDLMVGEKYDARRELDGFFCNGFKDPYIRKARLADFGYENLQAQVFSPVEVLEEVPAVSIRRISADSILVDFGKTVAGRVRVALHEERNREIRIEHSEVLGKNGEFLMNIQTAFRNQTDIYICKGNETEIYEPRFTYHGFRYVKISGITSQAEISDFHAIVIGSRLESTGDFSCSDERLNQLQKNIMRSQISNMISIPTDCPQREKAGWTGDVQIYASTACYLQNLKEFFRRWLGDVRYEQAKDGQIPIIVPMPPGTMRSFEGIHSSAGWGDVIVILPWVLYEYYGDVRVLEENYNAMEQWVSYIQQTAYNENPEELSHIEGERAEHLKYIWNTNFHFGDWLTPSVSINKDTGAVDLMQSAYMTMDIVPTFFYAYSCRMMARISKILGYTEKEIYYQDLFTRVKQAFQYEYLNDDLTIKSDLQGIQVLALYTGVVEGEAKRNTLKKLVRLIHENGDLLDTGFLSVPYLLDVLTENGERELAYKILYNEDCPSWLYEVKMGATSIWESWQALLPDGSCGYVSMAHYAFGCVGNWIYRNITGIRSLEPGYKRIEICPDFQCGLASASGYHDSVYGRISCSWEWKGAGVDVSVQIPFNTKAYICLGQQKETVGPGSYQFYVKKEEM